jgi:hypothetical protein
VGEVQQAGLLADLGVRLPALLDLGLQSLVRECEALIPRLQFRVGLAWRRLGAVLHPGKDGQNQRRQDEDEHLHEGFDRANRQSMEWRCEVVLSSQGCQPYREQGGAGAAIPGSE